MWLAPTCRWTRRTPGAASAASFTSPARGRTAPSARAHGLEEWPPASNSPYSASKCGSDLLALAYHRAHGLDAVVTRCSNNYEPYQSPEKAIPLFITNLIEGNTVPLYGDGRSIRDWLHVSDHCRGIDLVLHGGKAGEIYHIGGGTEVSSHKHTGLLLDAVGTGWHRVEYVADRAGHGLRCSPGDNKIREHLGYAPQVAFTDGLAGTVARYCERRSWWEPLKARAELR